MSNEKMTNMFSFKVADVQPVESFFCPANSNGKFAPSFVSIETNAQAINAHLGQTLQFECGETNFPLVDQNRLKHGFLGAAFTAYNFHIPLAFGPDDFWLLITQGIAQHLGGDPKRAEEYRHKFVEHKGKKELVVYVDKYGMGKDKTAANKGTVYQN